MSESGDAVDRGVLTARLANSSQWERLLEAAREWLAEEPENPSAHRYSAQALINLARHKEAGPHLQKLLSLRPDDSTGHRMMSMVHFEANAFAKADESIKQAIAIDPEDSSHWYHLARMCYMQKDLVSGLKWISKAQELAPNDPDILNLYALCSNNAEIQASLLQQVLALDPENAFAHNNLGTFYLGKGDHARAEECFRRALTIDPTLRTARDNLFLTIKQRDAIYRGLCAPRDFLLQLRHSIFGGEKRNPAAMAIGAIVWIFLFRFVGGGLILWFALVWPMVKVYEFLIVGDLRRKAGEIGSRRGGFLLYKQWPLKLRLALFATLLLVFWASVCVVYVRGFPGNDGKGGTEYYGVFAAVAVVFVLGYFLRILFRKAFNHFTSWRRERRLKHLETS